MRRAIAVRSVQTMAETLGAPPSSASGLAHIGSCANGPDGRKCSSAVLWCGRSWLIAQTMPVWSYGSWVTGMPAARRSGELRPSAATTSRQSMRGTAGDVHGGAVVAPLHLGGGRREHAQRRQTRACARSAPRAGCAPPPCGRMAASSPASRWSKCRNSGEAGRPRRPSLTRMSRIGQAGLGQPVPHAGLLQQAARAGGNGVGAAVECRVLHRRQRGAVHHHGGDAGGGQPAGQRAADRAGSHHAHLGRQMLAHVRTVAPDDTPPASRGSAASATQVFAAYSCDIARTAGAKGPNSHGHRQNRRDTSARLTHDPGADQQRSAELTGLVLGLAGLALLVALACYDPRDPSLNTATSRHTGNLAGPVGAVLADLLLQGFRRRRRRCRGWRCSPGRGGSPRGADWAAWPRGWPRWWRRCRCLAAVARGPAGAADIRLADGGRAGRSDRPTAGIDRPVGRARRAGAGRAR